jgi:hypothetical protein
MWHGDPLNSLSRHFRRKLSNEHMALIAIAAFFPAAPRSSPSTAL